MATTKRKNRGKAQYLIDNGRGVAPKPPEPKMAALKVIPDSPSSSNETVFNKTGTTKQGPALKVGKMGAKQGPALPSYNYGEAGADKPKTSYPKPAVPKPSTGYPKPASLSKGSTTPAYQPAGSTEQRGAVASTTFKGNWVNAGPTELQKRGGARSTAASRKLAREDFGRNR